MSTNLVTPAPPDCPTEPVWTRPRHQRTGRRRRLPAVVAALLVFALLGGLAAVVLHRRWDDSDRSYLGVNGWPVHGQATYAVGDTLRSSPRQRPVPIASLAKVMTAWLVLRAHPLHGDEAGFTMTVTSGDVADTARRRASQQSLVPVRAGERLTERDALAAVLLPSANNVSTMLARRTAGTVARFVAQMNREAARLGMRDTRYTDPSGFTDTTVSTARDQTVLARAVSHDSTLTALVALRSYRLPVAGIVQNTDVLLGQDGFVGTKTGSDDAAGGCFMFTTWRVVHRRPVAVVGAVLGQHGHSYVRTGQYAARQLADRVAPATAG